MKFCLQATYPADFCIICILLSVGKQVKKKTKKKNNDYNKTFLCTGSYDKKFCTKSWHLIIMCKLLSKKKKKKKKNYFLKDVECTI